MGQIARTGGNRVEHLERGDDLAGAVDLDTQLAVAGRGDALCKSLCTGAETRKVLGPAGQHLQLSPALRQRRRCQRCTGGPQSCRPEKPTASQIGCHHVSSLGSYRSLDH
ncbi:hypothetical protein MHM97_18405 [Epibacterium sp. Ofav1-8]|nr:hypothetical protein [Epibacterium sp. Ofav1-8]MCG7625331.1 hypothetical protein [Epibacterium sp. Ofav1-8]